MIIQPQESKISKLILVTRQIGAKMLSVFSCLSSKVVSCFPTEVVSCLPTEVVSCILQILSVVFLPKLSVVFLQKLSVVFLTNLPDVFLQKLSYVLLRHLSPYSGGQLENFYKSCHTWCWQRWAVKTTSGSRWPPLIRRSVMAPSR